MITPSLKLLVCYHKPAVLFRNEFCVPIHCGRATLRASHKDGLLSDDDRTWLLNNCIGDDTGDNISARNDYYNEVTGIYWAWKNCDKLGNPDYIGFMHYRRCFVFPDEEQGDARIRIPYMCEEDFTRYLCTDDLQLGKYDMYVPRWIPSLKCEAGISGWALKNKTPEICKTRDRGIGNEADDEALKFIRQNYPIFYESACDYYEKKENIQWNMFVFRRTIFMEYAQFLFDVLTGIEQKIIKPGSCTCQRRRLAILGETLTGIYIYHKEKERKCRIKELSVLQIEDTALPVELRPAYERDNVAVCCAVDNRNWCMCEVMIQSIISHASSAKNYDIVILWNTLSNANKKKILLLSNGHSNISVRLYRVNRFVERRYFRTAEESPYTSLFLLCIPEVFKNYERVLYLGHDVVTQTDIAELYDTEIGDNYIAACRDITIVAGLNSKKEKVEYYSQTLGIGEPHTEYVNKDVVLFNVRKMREMDSCRDILKLVEDNEYRHPAQDALNHICYARVHVLNSLWNVCAPWVDQRYIPADEYWQYRQDLDNAKILSFRGTLSKPWNNAALEYASCWWRYASQTPVYEELLTINTRACVSSQIRRSEEQEVRIKDTLLLPEYRRKLKHLRWRIRLSWGTKRQFYLKQKDQLKHQIKKIENFLKHK